MNRLRRYIRARRVSRALSRDPQFMADVEETWRRLASGELDEADRVDIEELRRLFLGTALSPEVES